MRLALRETTAYEGQGSHHALDPAAIKPGVRVRVWYRGVGERHPVADKVRVLVDAAAQ